MIAVFRTPAHRIVFAVALSALIHAAILWLPQLRLPRDKIQLPPLTARLEFQPKSVAQPAVRPEPANPVSTLGEGVSSKLAAKAASAMKEMKKSTVSHLFPKHVQLAFAVYRGTDIFSSGKVLHQLDIYGDRYTLKAIRQIAGLSSSEQITQTSRGKIDEKGMRPEIYKEEKISKGKGQSLGTTFDWPTQKLHFSGGGEIALPADAQDILSFMYQLSQLPMNREIIPLSIGDGAHLENYRIEIGGEEDISTPMGDLRALHLRKMHAEGEAYFEIWLGQEYRLLPVKIRQVDGSGVATEELVISDIRAADE